MLTDRPSEPILTRMDTISSTHSDRQALTPGIKTALRRLHVNLGHPTNDDLTRRLAAGGGTRVAQRAVKCLRCLTCEKVSRLPQSQTISRILTDEKRFNEMLFVDVCDVVDVRGNRYRWLVAVDQHTDYTVIAPCPSHKSQTVAKKLFKHWIRWAGSPDVLRNTLCDGERGQGASEILTEKTLGVRDSGANHCSLRERRASCDLHERVILAY